MFSFYQGPQGLQESDFRFYCFFLDKGESAGPGTGMQCGMESSACCMFEPAILS